MLIRNQLHAYIYIYIIGIVIFGRELLGNPTVASNMYIYMYVVSILY